MSKSLKNFITIKESLESMTATQLRIMFLLHAWDKTLDYSDRSLSAAKVYEKEINNFIINVRAIVRESRAAKKDNQGKHNFTQNEKQLLALFQAKQSEAHSAICNNFNTPQLLKVFRDLISAANTYIQEHVSSTNEGLLEKIAKYVVRMHRILGVFPEKSGLEIGISAESSASIEDVVAPFIRVFSSFRDNVRSLAQSRAESKEFLALSDKLRDEELFNLGIRLDDRDDGKALIKFIDPEILKRERDEKIEKELEKQREKEKRLHEHEQKRLEKLAKGKTPPNELFKDTEGLAQYSKFDDYGIPTNLIDGTEVTKNARKKLQKAYDAQIKLHEEYNVYISTKKS
ncbi:hypothetical protein HK096_008667 [Nowakowskiella sp. JEL0078]|nr:hypothetical protein HK096_008667 [Nowakowskiella sp. JEL0078]